MDTIIAPHLAHYPDATIQTRRPSAEAYIEAAVGSVAGEITNRLAGVEPSTATLSYTASAAAAVASSAAATDAANEASASSAPASTPLPSTAAATAPAVSDNPTIDAPSENILQLQSELSQLTMGIQALTALLQAQGPSSKVESQIAALQSAISSQTYNADASSLIGGGAPNTIAAASAIDSERMVINVRRSKGGKDRYVMPSEQLLAILRDYWKRAKPTHWLFPGPDLSQPITTRSLQRAFHEAAQAAGLDKSVTVHTLRHSFATHLLEQKVDIRSPPRAKAVWTTASSPVSKFIARDIISM